MSELVKMTDRALEKVQEVKNPVGAYLSGLGGPASRRTQLTALRAAVAALRGMETAEVSLLRKSGTWTGGLWDLLRPRQSGRLSRKGSALDTGTSSWQLSGE